MSRLNKSITHPYICLCFCAQRVWDELDVWHSCVAALEVDMQDLEKPEEAMALTEKLVEVQQLHSQLAKQAEQRTTLISKVRMPSGPFSPSQLNLPVFNVTCLIPCL